MEMAQYEDDIFYKEMAEMQKEQDKAFKELYQIIKYSKYQEKITTEQAIKILFFYPHLKVDRVTYHSYIDSHFGRVYIKSNINVYIGDYYDSFYHCVCLDSNCIEDALMLPKIAKEMCYNIGAMEDSFKAIKVVIDFYENESKNKSQEVEIERLNAEIKDLRNLLYRPTGNSYSIKSQAKQKCYIMIDASTNYVKIGKSQNPGHRERTLQAEKPTIKMIHVFKDDIEKELHSKFNDRRLRGEWFDLSENEVNEIIELYS
jgi:hypothetical protein